MKFGTLSDQESGIRDQRPLCDVGCRQRMEAMRVLIEQRQARATRCRGGAFLLDAQWRWVDASPVAHGMVAAGWWRGELMAYLHACHPSTHKAWHAVQQEMDSGSASALVIPVQDGNGALVAFANVHAYSPVAAGEHAARYVLYVRPLQWADSDALHLQLQCLFRLTAAESKFAVALRRQGDTAHAAAAVGIASSSARTRLQSILEKTGMHRQSELLLMIDALAETVP